MTDEQIAALVEATFREQFGNDALAKLEVDPKPFPAIDRPWSQSGLDSLDKMEFVMALEDAFQVEITDMRAEKLHTLADAARIVADLMAGRTQGER
jgi:acyl carrier protein